MPMEQHDRRAVTPVPHEDRRVVKDLNLVFLEAFEHARTLPQPRALNHHPDFS